MSNNVFQNVIVQLKDISERTFGVIDGEDEQNKRAGAVIASALCCDVMDHATISRCAFSLASFMSSILPSTLRI